MGGRTLSPTEGVRVDGYFGGSDVMAEMSAKEVFRQVCVRAFVCVFVNEEEGAEPGD